MHVCVPALACYRACPGFLLPLAPLPPSLCPHPYQRCKQAWTHTPASPSHPLASLPPLTGHQPFQYGPLQTHRDSYASLTLTRSSLPSSSGPHSNPRRRTAGSPDIVSRRTGGGSGAGSPGSPHGMPQTMCRGDVSLSPARGMANRVPARCGGCGWCERCVIQLSVRVQKVWRGLESRKAHMSVCVT